MMHGITNIKISYHICVVSNSNFRLMQYKFGPSLIQGTTFTEVCNNLFSVRS